MAKLFARAKAIDTGKVEGVGSNDCILVEFVKGNKVVYEVSFDGKGLLVLNEVGQEIMDNEL
jgi:hypothetical protein